MNHKEGPSLSFTYLTSSTIFMSTYQWKHPRCSRCQEDLEDAIDTYECDSRRRHGQYHGRCARPGGLFACPLCDPPRARSESGQDVSGDMACSAVVFLYFIVIVAIPLFYCAIQGLTINKN